MTDKTISLTSILYKKSIDIGDTKIISLITNSIIFLIDNLSSIEPSIHNESGEIFEEK